MLNIFIYITRLLNYINTKQIRGVFYNIENNDDNLLDPWWVTGWWRSIYSKNYGK